VILFWTFYFIPIIATVRIAVTINKTVAITDLNDKRAIPQIPCPLVHPLATFVPIPTSSPPAIINGSEFVIRNGISFVVENENIIDPTTRPTRNKKLSPLPSFEVRKLSVILLMPASRPLPIKNTTTAKPIVIPPTKADKGVKFIIFILIFLYLYMILSA